MNIGLELGASSDCEKGVKLLNCSQIQPLFQVGYQQLMNVRWKAEKFLKQNGSFLEWMFSEFHKDQLTALLGRFPKVAEVDGCKESLNWRNFASLQDVRKAEFFLDQWGFYLRFARKGLGLNNQIIKEYLDVSYNIEKNQGVDLNLWVIMALARHTLFKDISCEPISEPAAKSFLSIIFLPEVFKNEIRAVRS